MSGGLTHGTTQKVGAQREVDGSLLIVSSNRARGEPKTEGSGTGCIVHFSLEWKGAIETVALYGYTAVLADH